MTLLYNLLMLAVDLVAVWQLRRSKGLLAWCGIMAGAGGIAVVLGVLLARQFENRFGIPRFWCYALILHGAPLLLATAIVWRRQRPRLAIVAALTATCILLGGADAFLIEPHWLEITNYRIISPKVHRPVRVVVIADLQTEDVGDYERDVLLQAMQQRPDLVLFAGDYVQGIGSEYSTLQYRLRKLLMDMHLGHVPAFAVQGNVDDYLNNHWMNIFGGTGVTPLSQTTSIELPDLDLTCLSLFDSFNPHASIPGGRPERFHLVVGHMPNFALGNVDADLLVAGHTHGGQVQVPAIGPLWVNCEVPHRWASGLSRLTGGRNLIVSRGIGMERGYAPRMRFCCRPELAVIDIVPEEKGKGDERH